MSDIRVRVGQENAIKVVSSISGSSNAINVIGGIASVTQLNVSGISSFNGDVFVNGNFFATEINGGSY